MSKSLASFLVESAQHVPERTAVRFMGYDTPFAELEDASNRLASSLQNLGVGPGKHVALYCINSPFFMASYFAILKTGATVVPINLLLHPKEVAFLIKDSGASVLIYHSVTDKAVQAIAQNLDSVEHFIAIGDTEISQAKSYSALLNKGDRAPVLVEPQSEEDVAALLYTGGTTGLPKGAMLTHKNLISNVRSVIEALHLGQQHDTFITVLPMFHSFGATVGFLAPVAAASTVVALPQFQPEATCKTIQDENATIFLGVPTMYAMMVNLPTDKNYDLTSLRYGVSGGAPMPMSVLEKFEARYHVTIYEGYGPTECSPVVSVNPIGGKRKLGTVGVPIPGVEIRVLDENGQEVPAGEVGEVCVRGDNVMKGYWNQSEETEKVFWGDWIRTGDLGKMDDEGYCTLIDRAKDLIIVHGINVYPRQVEDVLYQHPAVAEAAVIGIADEYHGEMVKAFVALREGQTAEPRELIQYCRQHLGKFEIPRRIEILDSLPKSGAGKILRRKLRDIEAEKKA
ncbi:long-chain-fatty-acid--CoA ligase [candidate division KSB1 bacterium]|nr:long-chain-fatty-acid--CoA ligase [candidate division KSB1 bacterium]